MVKVSIVMCCYNSERYIKETIDSVLNQTFEDFEFIIWNDGSTDSTRSIIESYSDPRIRLFSDINRGEGMAAQLACRKASGKYIARIDSDDVWLPQKLEDEYKYLENHPDVVMVSCPIIFIDRSGKELGVSFPVMNVSFLTKSIMRENRFVHSGSMYRTEIYKKTGGYCDIRLFQDWLLFRKMSEFGNLALMPCPLIKYRLLPNSVAHRVEESPYLPVILEFQKKIILEKGAVQEDIQMFNSLYQLIKKTNDDNKLIYTPTIQEKVYKILCNLLGNEISYRIVTCVVTLFHVCSLRNLCK